MEDNQAQRETIIELDQREDPLNYIVDRVEKSLKNSLTERKAKGIRKNVIIPSADELRA